MTKIEEVITWIFKKNQEPEKARKTSIVKAPNTQEAAAQALRKFFEKK